MVSVPSVVRTATTLPKVPAHIHTYIHTTGPFYYRRWRAREDARAMQVSVPTDCAETLVGWKMSSEMRDSWPGSYFNIV